MFWFIGNVEDWIKEDYFCILWFFRFYVWYGYFMNGIDVDGLVVCVMYIEGLGILLVEWIGIEIKKFLLVLDLLLVVVSFVVIGGLV